MWHDYKRSGKLVDSLAAGKLRLRGVPHRGDMPPAAAQGSECRVAHRKLKILSGHHRCVFGALLHTPLASSLTSYNQVDACYLCGFVPLIELHAFLNMFDIISAFSIAMIICVCIWLTLTI